MLYVDDNFTEGSTEVIEFVVQEVQVHGLNIAVERKLTDYLSCKIILSNDKNKAWVGQPHMIKQVKKTFWDQVKTCRSIDLQAHQDKAQCLPRMLKRELIQTSMLCIGLVQVCYYF